MFARIPKEPTGEAGDKWTRTPESAGGIELDEESGHRSVLVVPVYDADEGAYLQELP
jgi:hypothetical protein